MIAVLLLLMNMSFNVEPLHYYRVRFEATPTPTNLWAVSFFDQTGAELPDCSEQLLATNDCYVRAHARAARAEVHTLPKIDHVIRQLRFEPVVDRTEVLRWADAIEIPPLRYTPPPGPKLPAGKKLRIVALGDSIVNDLSNTGIDVLLERALPGTQIEWINSVRSATGCEFYQDHVQEYVTAYRPDFVIIGGISHGYEAAPIAKVIKQIHVPVLVLTGAIAPEAHCRKGIPAERIAGFPVELARVGVPVLDLRSEWNRYLTESGKPLDWFLRDPIHANARGKQVIARILLRYLTGAE